MDSKLARGKSKVEGQEVRYRSGTRGIEIRCSQKTGIAQEQSTSSVWLRLTGADNHSVMILSLTELGAKDHSNVRTVRAHELAHTILVLWTILHMCTFLSTGLNLVFLTEHKSPVSIGI